MGQQSPERASASWGNLFCLSASLPLIVYLIICLTAQSETPCVLLLLRLTMFAMTFVSGRVVLWQRIIFFGEKTKLRLMKSSFTHATIPGKWFETHSQHPLSFSCSIKQVYYTIIHILYCKLCCRGLHKLVISPYVLILLLVFNNKFTLLFSPRISFK